MAGIGQGGLNPIHVTPGVYQAFTTFTCCPTPDPKLFSLRTQYLAIKEHPTCSRLCVSTCLHSLCHQRRQIQAKLTHRWRQRPLAGCQCVGQHSTVCVCHQGERKDQGQERGCVGSPALECLSSAMPCYGRPVHANKGSTELRCNSIGLLAPQYACCAAVACSTLHFIVLFQVMLPDAASCHTPSRHAAPTCSRHASRVVPQGAGYQLVVTHLREGSVGVADVDWARPTAFVMGNEKHGVSEEMVAAADACVTIPMVGAGGGQGGGGGHGGHGSLVWRSRVRRLLGVWHSLITRWLRSCSARLGVPEPD